MLDFHRSSIPNTSILADEFVEKISDAFMAGMLFRRLNPLSDAAKDAKYRIFVTKAAAQERKFKPPLRKLFREQKAEVIKKVENSGKAIHKATVEEILFDEAKWRLRFQEFGQLLLPGILEEAGKDSMGTLVTGVDFNVTNPRVQQFIKTRVPQFSFDVNNTTLLHLRRELVSGLTEGEGIPLLRKRVERVFGFAERYRTERIARTEVMGASNKGAHEAMHQSDVVDEKAWLATRDDRTRERHADMDGEHVPLNQLYSNGLMHPHDFGGDASEIVNCRCAEFAYSFRE